ncbi:MAG: HU family DNA-binding protein [Alloprevotella sp.]
MEKKLLLQEVADLLATKTGISRKAADSFSRLFFDLIVEGLTKDKYVKIKGLGTFKIVSVGERESINIHTGERIQISGHNKITFTQDPFIKDLVNKPFAHFQTVPLNDETEISELEEVDQMPIVQSYTTDDEDDTPEEMTEETEPSAEETPTEEEKTENVSAEAVGEDEDEATAKSEEDNMPSADTTPADDKTADTSVELEEDNQPATPEVTPAEEDPSEELQTEEDTQEAEANTSDEQPSTTEEPESEEVEVEELGPAKTYTVQPIGGTGHGGHHGPVDFVVEIRSDKRLAKWKMIALGLFVVILMGAAYCIGYYRVLTPGTDQNSQPAATEMKTAKPQDAKPAAKTTPAKPQKTAESSSQTKTEETKDKSQTATPATKAEEGQPQTTAAKAEPSPAKQAQTQPQPATPRYHIVKSGENLYGIAKKVYGSKSYAPLIIKANHIKNPDLVDVGTKLILPEAEGQKP